MSNKVSTHAGFAETYSAYICLGDWVEICHKHHWKLHMGHARMETLTGVTTVTKGAGLKKTFPI